MKNMFDSSTDIKLVSVNHFHLNPPSTEDSDGTTCSHIPTVNENLQLFTYRNTKKEFTIWKKKEELGNYGENLTGGIKKEKTIWCRQIDMLQIAEQIIKKNCATRAHNVSQACFALHQRIKDNIALY
jgi:hypothetical protein